MSTSATTVDVQFGSQNNSYSSYSVTAYTVASTSTLTVWTKSWNNSFWKQVGLIGLSDGANVTSISASTTAKEFLILDTQPYKIRVLFSGTASSTTTVLITGKFGSVISGTTIGGTTVSLTGANTVGLGTGTNYIGSTSLPNDNALDSARFNLSYQGSGTYTIGYVIGAATSPSTTPCPMIRLSNAGRVAGGSGYITQIIFFHDSATSTGTIRATFSRDSTGLTMFADKVPYAPSFEALTQRVTSDTVQMFAGTGSGTSFSKGIKSCFLPYVCSAGSTSLWMRLSSESAIVLKNGGCIFYKVTYARN
jgi:hypothetical protein